MIDTSCIIDTAWPRLPPATLQCQTAATWQLLEDIFLASSPEYLPQVCAWKPHALQVAGTVRGGGYFGRSITPRCKNVQRRRERARAHPLHPSAPAGGGVCKGVAGGRRRAARRHILRCAQVKAAVFADVFTRSHRRCRCRRPSMWSFNHKKKKPKKNKN